MNFAFALNSSLIKLSFIDIVICLRFKNSKAMRIGIKVAIVCEISTREKDPFALLITCFIPITQIPQIFRLMLISLPVLCKILKTFIDSSFYFSYFRSWRSHQPFD